MAEFDLVIRVGTVATAADLSRCDVGIRDGRIAALAESLGADADIAIWDPEHEVTISHEQLHDNLDYTPYEGMVVRGWPVITLSRGEVVWRDGKVTGDPGRGRFLRCDPPFPTSPKE